MNVVEKQICQQFHILKTAEIGYVSKNFLISIGNRHIKKNCFKGISFIHKKINLTSLVG